FVPLRIALGRPQPERAAEIDDLDAGLEQTGSQFERNFRRSRQKHGRKPLRADCLGGRWYALRPRMAARRGPFAGVMPMLEQNRLDAAVPSQYGPQLRSAVSAKAHNPDRNTH